jgi:hypothetical protein
MMSATNPAGKDLITPLKVKEKEYGGVPTLGLQLANYALIL